MCDPCHPFSQAVAADLQKTLNAETAAASRVHFPIKVALIDSPVDLGAIPSLFAKPQQYADYLDQEITFPGTTQPREFRGSNQKPRTRRSHPRDSPGFVMSEPVARPRVEVSRFRRE